MIKVLSYVAFSQIWLNLTTDDCHFGYITKLRKKKSHWSSSSSSSSMSINQFIIHQSIHHHLDSPIRMDSPIINVFFFFFPNFLMESGWRASLGTFTFAWRHVSQILYVARALYIWMCPHPRQKNWFLFAISRLFFQIKGIYDRIFPFLPTQKKRKKMGGFYFKGFSSFFFNFLNLKIWRIFCFQKIIKLKWLNLHQKKKIPIFLGLKSQKIVQKKKSLMGF